jgi:hypothetical protein
MSDSICDLYDHEVEEILQLQVKLNDRARHRRHNYNDFDREIREAFAEIGFTVEVNWHEFSVGGQVQEGAMPEVTVTGRTDPSHVFDKDRQVHEVTHNVLGLPEEDAGVIKADRETLRNFMEGNGHGHGHSH